MIPIKARISKKSCSNKISHEILQAVQLPSHEYRWRKNASPSKGENDQNWESNFSLVNPQKVECSTIEKVFLLSFKQNRIKSKIKVAKNMFFMNWTQTKSIVWKNILLLVPAKSNMQWYKVHKSPQIGDCKSIAKK